MTVIHFNPAQRERERLAASRKQLRETIAESLWLIASTEGMSVGEVIEEIGEFAAEMNYEED